MAVGPQESVLAPRFTRVISVLLVVICVTVEVALVSYGNVGVLLRATPAVAFVALGSYVFFWAPLVRINPTDIEIINPLRTHTIGWRAVTDISTRWNLTVMTANRSIEAWAAPSRGPWASIGRLHRDAFGRPSLRTADTGRAASAPGLNEIVVDQWTLYRDDTETGDDVRTVWHRATVVALTVLGVLTVVGAAWH
ncbi:hypothetical protein BH09ACT1_BH09ACT1_27050 [soil metagenome]